MLSGLAALLLGVVGFAGAGGLEEFRRAGPRCSSAAPHCFGIDLHIVVEDGKPVQTPAWFAEQVEVATRLFAPIEVEFELRSVQAEDTDRASIETRLDRDLLGRKRFSAGVVHVYVVRRLADVDIEGAEIRGVHWRDRGDVSRRWIILSSIGKSRVLAHELGHFFGLRHSTHAVSIMNKTPREHPPWESRRFADPEVERMRSRLRRMLGNGQLENRRKRRRQGR